MFGLYNVRVQYKYRERRPFLQHVHTCTCTCINVHCTMYIYAFRVDYFLSDYAYTQNIHVHGMYKCLTGHMHYTYTCNVHANEHAKIHLLVSVELYLFC